MADNFIGTVIIQVTEDTLDMHVSSNITKEQLMDVLYETMVGVEDIPIEDTDAVPEGRFGVSSLQ